jgi:hypothetical protein
MQKLNTIMGFAVLALAVVFATGVYFDSRTSASESGSIPQASAEKFSEIVDHLEAGGQLLRRTEITASGFANPVGSEMVDLGWPDRVIHSRSTNYDSRGVGHTNTEFHSVTGEHLATYSWVGSQEVFTNHRTGLVSSGATERNTASRIVDFIARSFDAGNRFAAQGFEVKDEGVALGEESIVFERTSDSSLDEMPEELRLEGNEDRLALWESRVTHVGYQTIEIAESNPLIRHEKYWDTPSDGAQSLNQESRALEVSLIN